MKILYDNGYIMQRKTESNYLGVDGDNWYLNYCSDESYFEDFYNLYIDKAWCDLDFVDCCSSIEYMQRYTEESMKLGIEFRVLLCATGKKEPRLEREKLECEKKFLGYDCAYSGGSYYSCVLNDIVLRRIEDFNIFQINENGLFNTYEEAEAFMLYRENKMNSSDDYVLEKGDFIIYEIREVCF